MKTKFYLGTSLSKNGNLRIPAGKPKNKRRYDFSIIIKESVLQISLNDGS